jgi:hypothetical protein
MKILSVLALIGFVVLLVFTNPQITGHAISITGVVRPTAAPVSAETVPLNVNAVSVLVLILIALIIIFWIRRKRSESEPAEEKYEKMLIPYIKDALRKGYTKEEIRNKFKEKGWPEGTVEKALGNFDSHNDKFKG